MYAALFIILLLFIILNEYGWKGGIYYTVAVSFLQDPIRKISEGQSAYYGGLCLLLFTITFLQLRSKQKDWLLRYVFWTNKSLLNLMSAFIYLLGLSSIISITTFRDIRLTIVGLLFYLLPLISVWVGFQIGRDLEAVRTMLKTYVAACSVTALSIIVSLWGIENKLLDEVGTGLNITGIDVTISGLWRTSEIAAWHLASGSCFAFLLGLCNKKTMGQICYFFLSLALVFLASTTSRRKAVGLVMMFAGLLLLLYVLTAKRKKYVQILTGILLVILLGLGIYNLLLNQNAVNIIAKSSERTATLNVDTTTERFSVQGVASLTKGLEVSGPFGFGVGAGSNTSNTGIDKSNVAVNLGFISEGGGGRVIAEIGWIGGILLLAILFNTILLVKRNFKIGLSYLETNDFMLTSGLSIFTLANIVTFFTAAQLYNDPFVLLIIGLTFGASLSVVVVSSNQKNKKAIELTAIR